jgi:2',3'-cyclic-nucleotide 2'-phosphodiesterase (5'-nucleotidase family)
LVLDSGNALFRNTGLDDSESKQRAKTVFRAMAEMGAKAMAVGARDLGAGVPFLVELGRTSPLKVLSANLRHAGKPMFDASTLVTVAGLRVGLVGVSPASTGVAALEPVREQVQRFSEKVDLVVVLAAAPYDEAMQLAEALKGQVDFVLQSSDSRTNLPMQTAAGTWVISSGERGRSVGKLNLRVAGKGLWVNESQRSQDQSAVESLDSKIRELKERRKGISDPKAAAQFDGTLREFSQRRAELARKTQAGNAQSPRTFRLEWVPLDTSFGNAPP